MLKDLRGKVLGETAEIVAAPERRKKPVKPKETATLTTKVSSG